MINTSHNAWTNPFDVCDVPAPQHARMFLLVYINKRMWKICKGSICEPFGPKCFFGFVLYLLGGLLG
ncbi:hypothetical protein Hanom_Chr10g00906081 [Helianthus anomalus]